LSDRTPDELVSLIRERVQAARAKLISLRLVRGLKLAPLIHVEVVDADSFRMNRAFRVRELLGQLSDLRAPIADGSLLKVTDQSGRLIYLQGIAARPAQGVGYLAPEATK